MTGSGAAALTKFQEACATLRALGIVLEALPGEYRVNFKSGAAMTAYRTDDLDDALSVGLVMAKSPAAQTAPLPPLGPLGPRNSRRSEMYRHNKRLAARRAKKSKQKV
jgi:hypothetical protein